jgi:hypothetical protein
MRVFKLLKFSGERENDCLIWRQMSRRRDRLRASEKHKRRVSRTCDICRRDIVGVVKPLRVTGKVTAVLLELLVGKITLSDSQENVFDLQSVGRFCCVQPHNSIRDLQVIKTSISLHDADFLLTNAIQYFCL